MPRRCSAARLRNWRVAAAGGTDGALSRVGGVAPIRECGNEGCLTVLMNYLPTRLRIETERLLLTAEEDKDAERFTEFLIARGTGPFTTEDARRRIDAMTATIEAIGIGALVLRTPPPKPRARCWRPPSKPAAVVSGRPCGRGTRRR